MSSTHRLLLLTIALISLPLQAEELGRLFFPPEQRAHLDYDYLQGQHPETIHNGVVLNGIVQKHGGKRTVWINGVAEDVGPSDELSPASERVTVPGKSKSVKMKVGQKVLSTPADPD